MFVFIYLVFMTGNNNSHKGKLCPDITPLNEETAARVKQQWRGKKQLDNEISEDMWLHASEIKPSFSKTPDLERLLLKKLDFLF